MDFVLSAWCGHFVILTNSEQTRTAESVAPVGVMVGQGEDTCVEWDTCHRGHVRYCKVAAEVPVEPEHLQLIIKDYDETETNKMFRPVHIWDWLERSHLRRGVTLCADWKYRRTDFDFTSFVFYLFESDTLVSGSHQFISAWNKCLVQNIITLSRDNINNSPEGDGSQRHSGGNQAAGQRGERRGMLALADTR